MAGRPRARSAAASSCPKLVLPAAVRPSTPTRSRPGLSLATRAATSPITAVRSADAAGGSGCRQVDTDSNACTPRLYERLTRQDPSYLTTEERHDRAFARPAAAHIY